MELTLAGKNLDWFYIAEGVKLFRRSAKVTGAAVSKSNDAAEGSAVITRRGNLSRHEST